MRLSRFIAQKIVEEMMNVVPYNINVMDENGVIIGSGDSSRIGAFHEGAKRAIHDGIAYEVFDEADGMKPGVNEPIIIGGKVIGVVGITGQPDTVRPFSKIVRVTAILLIEQISINEKERKEKLNRERFYYELSVRKYEYDKEFTERAQIYGINPNKKFQSLIIEGSINSKEIESIRESYGHSLTIDSNRAVFFIQDNYIYSQLLQQFEASKQVNKIASGNNETFASVSLENAMTALEVGAKIKPSAKLYRYDDLKFLAHLSCDYKEDLLSLFANLDKSGGRLELIQTLKVYIEENGEINEVAAKLNIHRNTLKYRLDKIEQLTGKNPKILIELFELLCGLIWR
jgi:Sugar diacid utilization regulator